LITNIVIGPPRWDAALVPQGAFEFHDATIAPERIGWWDTIRRMTAHPVVRGSVALIVDSDLGRLTALNAREEPILDGFYLPEGFTLLYASAEIGP
jgi:hypothetical protein